MAAAYRALRLHIGSSCDGGNSGGIGVSSNVSMARRRRQINKQRSSAGVAWQQSGNGGGNISGMAYDGSKRHTPRICYRYASLS